MDLDKLAAWAMGIVMAFAAAGRLDVLQSWIWGAQAQVLYESRSSTWGSPRFFPAKTRSDHGEVKLIHRARQK